MSDQMPPVAVGQVWRHKHRGHRVEVVDMSPATYGQSRARGLTMRHLDKGGPDYVLFQDRIAKRYELVEQEADR